jgi:hypothetical protein
MDSERGKLIHVDFANRRRGYGYGATAPVGSLLPEALSAVVKADDFLVFWRSPQRRHRGEYLGGRWNRGWMLFVWTGADQIGESWRLLVEERGYVPQHLDRGALRNLLATSTEVVGLIVNGDIDPETHTVRAAPDQVVRRTDSLRLLLR